MKRSRTDLGVWLVFLCFLILSLVTTSNALALEPDARSFAMGGAYTAVVDDPTAVYWNPAALTEVKYVGGELWLGLEANAAEEIQKLDNFLEKCFPEEGSQPAYADPFDLQAVLGAGLNLAVLRHVGAGANIDGGINLKGYMGERTVSGSTVYLPHLMGGFHLRAESAVGLAAKFKGLPFNLVPAWGLTSGNCTWTWGRGWWEKRWQPDLVYAFNFNATQRAFPPAAKERAKALSFFKPGFSRTAGCAARRG